MTRQCQYRCRRWHPDHPRLLGPLAAVAFASFGAPVASRAGAALVRAGAAAQLARAGDHDGDLIAAELRAAITGLEELLGEVTSDDVLNQIFAEFCIGK